MDEFLAQCVEYLEENKAAGLDPQKSVMFIERQDGAIVMYHGGTTQQILERALQAEINTGCLRATTFSKRDKDDFWVVALLPHFPVVGYEYRIYPSNSNEVPDLDADFIPGEMILEAKNALEK